MDAAQIYQNASDVRKNWSFTIDTVIHDRPAFINRTHDYFMMLNAGTIKSMLNDYKYHIEMENEPDGSFTGYLVELELAENAPSKEKLIENMLEAMKDYALDYYSEFSFWSKAPNRASHVPYVLKILISDDETLREDMVCQNGKN